MIKLLLLTSLFSFAYAEGIEPSIFDTVFKDAALFFTLFGALSVVSIVISRKNARTYEHDHPIQERIDTAKEKKLVGMYLNSSHIKIVGIPTMLLELSKILKEKAITEKEFRILKRNLNTNVNT